MKNQIAKLIMSTPLIGKLAARIWALLLFPGSAEWWESRYHRGGTSGEGSYGRLAEVKAEVLNSFVADNGVESVIEFGCGDGNQLSLAVYPRYIGIHQGVLMDRLLFRIFLSSRRAN